MLSWERFVFGAKCSIEANASLQGNMYQLNSCLLCDYITPDCTEHPHSMELAGISLFTFRCGNLCPELKNSLGIPAISITKQKQDKGNKIANDKRPRCSSSKVLFPINMVELRMSMKVCHLAKFVPSKDIS